jgi:hypothetical protein
MKYFFLSSFLLGLFLLFIVGNNAYAANAACDPNASALDFLSGCAQNSSGVVPSA